MRSFKKILIYILILSTFTISLFSQNKETDSKSKLPGDTSLPNSDEELSAIAAQDKGTYKYKIENFFASSAQTKLLLSPDGKNISYFEGIGLYVKNLSSHTITKVFEGRVADYNWINPTHLYLLKDNDGDENEHLYSLAIDGKSPAKDLTPYEKVKVDSVFDLNKDDSNTVVIVMNKENPKIFLPYNIDINTGTLTLLFKNTANEVISDYILSPDKKDIAGYFSSEKNGDKILYYKFSKNGKYEKILTITWKITFDFIKFNEISDNPHDIYVLSNLDNDTKQIILYDLKEKKILAKLFSNANYDINGFKLANKNRNYEIDYYSYYGEKPELVPISSLYNSLYASFKNKFENMSVKVVGNDENETNFLISVLSDTYIGAYYFYNISKNEYTLISEVNPNLDPADMASIRPIQFEARDGLLIHGYLAIPSNKIFGEKPPLILYPHGGPYGQRDYWDFDFRVQVMASRGYSVLQINYRGSGGYGKKFVEAGSKQMGKAMLTDLEDGVAYVKSLDLIDQNKVIVFGASYGGLATLQSLIQSPDNYLVGVDFVGVSNIFTFFKNFPKYWEPYKAQFYEQWGHPEKDKKYFEEISPVFHADKIKVPLFVAQGANDPRVNIDESDQIVKSLRARGNEVIYMVKYDEGHGYYLPKNLFDFFSTFFGFLYKHVYE